MLRSSSSARNRIIISHLPVLTPCSIGAGQVQAGDHQAISSIGGFALVQGFGNPDLKLHLKRIAVKEPGGGLGSILLEGVIGRIFAETDVNRIDLDVFVGNDRARRAYEKAGFVLEGVLRDYHRRPDGSFASMWLMSLLRSDRAGGNPA